MTITAAADHHPLPALQVEGLLRAYGSRIAVRDVNFSVAAGEIICLLGSSGCGKTTLLRLIAGLEAPDAGSVHMDGAMLSGPRAFVPPERRGIGLVFQDYALFPHLSVLSNVMFGLKGDRATRRERAIAALKRVRLEERGAGFPHMLSGGEQQRVALARAMAPRPRLLLMDEPFSNLDRGLRDRVREETLAIVREAGITAVIVTHDPEEALRIADRIVLLREGSVEQVASPEALYRQPATLYAARFFSELVELQGRCRSGQVVTALGNFPAAGLSDDRAARVALRPHDLQIALTREGVPAQVLERIFLGGMQQLRIAVEGVAEPLLLQMHGPGAASPGDRVFVHADPHAAFVFPGN